MASARGDVFSSQNLALTSHTMDPERVQKTSRGPSVPPSETSAWRAVVRVLRSTASGTLNSLTSVVFPADCRVCNLPLSGFSFLPVCNSCWNNLPEQFGVLCARCGESLQGEPLSGEAVCRVCRVTAPPFDKAVAHGIYSGELKAFVHLLKYDGMEPIARRLGILIADQVLTIPDLSANLMVIPVPLFARKRRQRGFNQSELLARSVTGAIRRRRPEMQIKLVEGALTRQRATESQAGLSPHQRRVNLRGAFSVPKPALVEGKNVLVIDDIYTTGATARACAQALRRAGAAHVWVATVARAQRKQAIAPGLSQGYSAGFSADSAALDGAEIPMQQDFAFWEEGRPDYSGGAAR